MLRKMTLFALGAKCGPVIVLNGEPKRFSGFINDAIEMAPSPSVALLKKSFLLIGLW